MKNIYLGIDPGKDGALVAINDDGAVAGSFLTSRDFTTTIGKSSKREYLASRMSYAIKCLGGKHNIKLAVVEKQSARPGQGVSSTFSTGFGYGLWVGILAAQGIPLLRYDLRHGHHIFLGTYQEKAKAAQFTL